LRFEQQIYFVTPLKIHVQLSWKPKPTAGAATAGRFITLYQDGKRPSRARSSHHFQAIFAWCQKHLRKGVRLNEEATRYLKTWALITYGSTSTTCDAIKRLLDALPLGRINKARLMETAAQGDDAGETEWVLPTGVDLSGRPTYQIRTILDERRINGRVVFLTSWEPTYEPAENLPSNEIKKFRKRKRKQVERAYIEAEAHEE